MWWWNGPHPMWGIGWIFPWIMLVFIIVVLFSISRIFGRRGSFCGGKRYDEIDDLRREVRELKDEVARLRRKE